MLMSFLEMVLLFYISILSHKLDMECRPLPLAFGLRPQASVMRFYHLLCHIKPEPRPFRICFFDIFRAAKFLKKFFHCFWGNAYSGVVNPMVLNSF